MVLKVLDVLEPLTQVWTNQTLIAKSKHKATQKTLGMHQLKDDKYD